MSHRVTAVDCRATGRLHVTLTRLHACPTSAPPRPIAAASPASRARMSSTRRLPSDVATAWNAAAEPCRLQNQPPMSLLNSTAPLHPLYFLPLLTFAGFPQTRAADAIRSAGAIPTPRRSILRL